MPTKRRWMPVRPKPARPKVPDDFKLEVQKKADAFLESYLKPTFILPLPRDPKFNYIVEIYTKRHQRYFYFCSKYRCVHENCISEFFESRFARLEYVGNKKFNVAYMRHTGQWWEILEGLSLEECFQEMREEQLLKREVISQIRKGGVRNLGSTNEKRFENFFLEILNKDKENEILSDFKDLIVCNSPMLVKLCSHHPP